MVREGGEARSRKGHVYAWVVLLKGMPAHVPIFSHPANLLLLIIIINNKNNLLFSHQYLLQGMRLASAD